MLKNRCVSCHVLCGLYSVNEKGGFNRETTVLQYLHHFPAMNRAAQPGRLAIDFSISTFLNSLHTVARCLCFRLLMKKKRQGWRSQHVSDCNMFLFGTVVIPSTCDGQTVPKVLPKLEPHPIACPNMRNPSHWHFVFKLTILTPFTLSENYI